MKKSIIVSRVTLQFLATATLLAAAGCSSGDNKAVPDAGTSSDAAVPGDGSGASATVKLASSATLGNYLTDGDGRTLYLYSKDFPATTGASATAAVSNCSAGCLTAWPVFH